MGRRNRATVTGATPSPSYEPPALTLDPPQETPMTDPAREIAETHGRANLTPKARAGIDAEDAAAMIGHDGEPLDPDLLGRIRDAREVHGALAVANAACYLDFPDWQTGDEVHKAINLRAADGMWRVDVPTREPRVMLLWGDETITEFKDDDRYENIGEHASPLRRKMMVLRLRHLANLIEGERDRSPEPGDVRL